MKMCAYTDTYIPIALGEKGFVNCMALALHIMQYEVVGRNWAEIAIVCFSSRQT